VGTRAAFHGSVFLGGVTFGDFFASGERFTTSWTGSYAGQPAQGTISCDIFLHDGGGGACTPTITCDGTGFNPEGSGEGGLVARQPL
jgi:hypothetical protein